MNILTKYIHARRAWTPSRIQRQLTATLSSNTRWNTRRYVPHTVGQYIFHPKARLSGMTYNADNGRAIVGVAFHVAPTNIIHIHDHHAPELRHVNNERSIVAASTHEHRMIVTMNRGRRINYTPQEKYSSLTYPSDAIQGLTYPSDAIQSGLTYYIKSIETSNHEPWYDSSNMEQDTLVVQRILADTPTHHGTIAILRTMQHWNIQRVDGRTNTATPVHIAPPHVVQHPIHHPEFRTIMELRKLIAAMPHPCYILHHHAHQSIWMHDATTAIWIPILLHYR